MKQPARRYRSAQKKGASINLFQRRLEFGTSIKDIISAEEGRLYIPTVCAPFRNTEKVYNTDTERHLKFTQEEADVYASVIDKFKALEDPWVELKKVFYVDPHKVAGALQGTGNFSQVAVLRPSWFKRVFLRHPQYVIHAVPKREKLKALLSDRPAPTFPLSLTWVLDQPYCPQVLIDCDRDGLLHHRTLSVINYCFNNNIYIDLRDIGICISQWGFRTHEEQMAVILASAGGLSYNDLMSWQRDTLLSLVKDGGVNSDSPAELREISIRGTLDFSNYAV